MAKGATILPPVEKLPLAVRKNVRDEFESKRADLEDQISKHLGVPWTIDVNPNAIYPYAEEGSYGQTSLGSCITSYIEGMIWKLDYLLKQQPLAKDELNKLCPEHKVTLDLDVSMKHSYTGCEIKDGALRLLFAQKYLGTNVSDSLSNLEEALNSAPQPDGAPVLSYSARSSIREYWEGDTEEELQEKIGKQLHNDKIKLNPNWDEVYKELKKSKDVRDDWERNMGSFIKYYFEAFLSTIEYNKFEQDDLLYEGFAEAVDKGEVCFRIVPKLVNGSYNEGIVEGGVYYMQTKPEYFGTNTSDVASKIVEAL